MLIVCFHDLRYRSASSLSIKYNCFLLSTIIFIFAFETLITMFGLFILFSYYFTSIYGHGYLFEPVARSSAWLVDPSFKQCCTWPQHMEMYCGGVGHQWKENGLSLFFYNQIHIPFSIFSSDGKCGICGEPYDKKVKLFEKGGAMYKGTIVKTYTQGQQIDVKVMVSCFLMKRIYF
jgi:hypothetical protein